MKQQALQKSYQVIEDKDRQALKEHGLTDDQIDAGIEIGLDKKRMAKISIGSDIIFGGKIISKGNIIEFSKSWFSSEAKDRRELDNNESLILRSANELRLFDSKVADELFIKAIEGTISPEIKTKIEEIQTRLMEDDKYNGQIDGKWGELSQNGLKNLITENAEALIIDSNKLQRHQQLENRQKLKDGLEK